METVFNIANVSMAINQKGSLICIEHQNIYFYNEHFDLHAQSESPITINHVWQHFPIDMDPKKAFKCAVWLSLCLWGLDLEYSGKEL